MAILFWKAYVGNSQRTKSTQTHNAPTHKLLKQLHMSPAIVCVLRTNKIFRKSLTSSSFCLKKSKILKSAMAATLCFPYEKFHLNWMSDMQPKFGISSKNVSILQDPKQFYEELKTLTEGATRRITIASLYIGTTDLEQELIDCIHEALSRKDSNVEVQILLDASRGSRGNPNSRTLLLPLLKAHADRVQVALYHSPHLRGWLRWILPERWNETVGLTHLKVYLFDDTLILSGANLNKQYFENRQDRYMVFRNCSALSNFFAALVTTVSQFSLQLTPKDHLTLHPQWKEHPYLGNQEKFLSEAHERLKTLLLQTWPEKECGTDTIDTWVLPLLQMKPLNICQDEEATQAFLVSAPKGSCIKIATGYFNMTQNYIDSILKSCQATYDLIIASPKVNGFFGAKGVAGAIPAAYVCIEKDFFHQVKHLGQRERVSILEYERDSWTFHAKGIWYYPPGASLPVLSFIGSPNFGYRSVYKDLEAQVALVTTSQKLQEELHYEQERLYKQTHVVSDPTFNTPDHQVALWVRLVTKIIKTFF